MNMRSKNVIRIQGWVHALASYITGCDRVAISRRQLDKDVALRANPRPPHAERVVPPPMPR